MLQDLQRSNAAREGGGEGEEEADEEGHNGRGVGGRGSFVFEIANGIVRELWMNRRGMSRMSPIGTSSRPSNLSSIHPSIRQFVH